MTITETTEGARKVFDKTLALKFAPAIKELVGLGYPGISDPKLIITTKVMTGETLKHDSVVQYALSKTDNTLKLPEKYNGLDYQNLISMVFDWMGFRDDWMREGKAKDTNIAIVPTHLVLVEEPEAHLHIQVQQVPTCMDVLRSMSAGIQGKALFGELWRRSFIAGQNVGTE